MTLAALQLPLLGEARELEVIEDASVPSRWSGKPLRRVHFQLEVANDQEHDSLQRELTPAGVDPVVLSGPDGTQWEVSSHSYTYSDNFPPVHSIGLTEREQLSLDGIEVDGLTLVPEHWEFETGDNLVLSFVANMNAEEREQSEAILKRHWAVDADADAYLPVALIGVTDQPMRMRFGRCLWQDLGNGQTRHQMVLVGEEGDNVPRGYPVIGQLFQPAADRLKEAKVRSDRKLNALIAELHDAGVLTDEAVARINEQADAPLMFSEMREFDRAFDLDDFS